jgi:hypothetical protein
VVSDLPHRGARDDRWRCIGHMFRATDRSTLRPRLRISLPPAKSPSLSRSRFRSRLTEREARPPVWGRYFIRSWIFAMAPPIYPAGREVGGPTLVRPTALGRLGSLWSYRRPRGRARPEEPRRRVAQSEAQIQPNRVLDDRRRKPMPTVPEWRHGGILSHQAIRSNLVSVATPVRAFRSGFLRGPS